MDDPSVQTEMRLENEPDIDAIARACTTFWSKRLDGTLRMQLLFALTNEVEGRASSALVVLPAVHENTDSQKLTVEDVFNASLQTIATLVGVLRKAAQQEHMDMTTVLASVLAAMSDGMKFDKQMRARLMASVAMIFLAPVIQDGPKGEQ